MNLRYYRVTSALRPNRPWERRTVSRLLCHHMAVLPFNWYIMMTDEPAKQKYIFCRHVMLYFKKNWNWLHTSFYANHLESIYSYKLQIFSWLSCPDSCEAFPHKNYHNISITVDQCVIWKSSQKYPSIIFQSFAKNIWGRDHWFYGAKMSCSPPWWWVAVQVVNPTSSVISGGN